MHPTPCMYAGLNVMKTASGQESKAEVMASTLCPKEPPMTLGGVTTKDENSRGRLRYGEQNATIFERGVMKQQAFCRWCVLALLCMALVTVLNAQTTKRPIEDFLTAQGKYSSFFPPVKDYLGWAQGLCTSGGLSCLSPHFDATRFCLGDFALVDYVGLADKYLVENGADSSGTVMDGTILERRLSDTSVEVTVTLHTKNALTFVLPPTPDVPPLCGFGFDFLSAPLLLGQRATAKPALADRALGESFLHISFINALGDPLPDLLDLFYSRYSDIKEYSFQAVATGPLRPAFGVADGTPGTVTVVQAGNGSRSNIQPAVVRLRRTGK
jgi:hypothetical protein